MNVGVNPCDDCAAWPVPVWLAAGCESLARYGSHLFVLSWDFPQEEN